MRRRSFATFATFSSMGAVVIVGLLLLPTPVAGQAATKAPTGTKATATKANAKTAASKTPWGDPDLQGVYSFSTLTPFQRPTVLKERVALTEAELAVQEERDADSRVAEDFKLPTGPIVDENVVGAYNNYWTLNEKGRRTGKTSLILDPEDGRIPELTPEGKKRREQLTAEAAARRIGPYALYNTWSDLPVYTQCIARPIPRIWQSYNHGVEILQTPGYVVIFYESMHNARLIPLDGRPHLPSTVRLWDGDSRGHWEGNTLVVDTTNFNDRGSIATSAATGRIRGIPQSEALHVIERFTPVDGNTIAYEVTIDDPKVYTKPWKAAIPLTRDSQYQIYEYACQEGNYAVPNELSGGRARDAAEQQPH
jgi:hypothetical protein